MRRHLLAVLAGVVVGSLVGVAQSGEISLLLSRLL